MTDEGYGFFLRQLLNHCNYDEDLEAARHFVFHPRRNGSSNVCLICDRGADGNLGEYGHSGTCAWPEAVQRLRGSKLSDYTDRK